MYFMAKSYQEKIRWIRTIQSVLQQNTQYDPMYSSNRTALANTLIDEYNRYHCNQRNTLGRISSKMINEVPQHLSQTCSDSIYTQVNWWKLMPQLMEYCNKEQFNNSKSLEINSISHLLSVIQLHQDEVIDSVLSLIDEKSMTNFSSLLTTNKSLHYPIGSDYFYEGNPKMTYFSNTDYLRPVILRIFLFHDILLVTTVPLKENKLLYYYHIRIEDLQVIDYCDSMNSDSVKSTNTSSQIISPNEEINFLTNSQKIKTLAIKLIDHSIKSKGFLSSLWSSGNSRERLLLASTIEQKQSWFELLTETIQSYKRNDSHFHQSFLNSTEGNVNKDERPPLIRRISSQGNGPWKYDERTSEADKKVEPIL